MKKIFLLILVLSIISVSVSAQIIHVPADQPSIQAGINFATDGDTVLVADGTYFENIRFKGKAITVASEYIMDGDTNHIDNTVIDGSQSSDPDSAACVMFINSEDTSSIINGFTITGGTGVFYPSWQVRSGGGIYTNNAGSKILNNKIIDNHVEGYNAGGAGIGCLWNGEDVWTIIDNNTISYNTSIADGQHAFGCGIAVSTNTVIKNNIIEYNTCDNDNAYADGGGIEVEQVPGSDIVAYIYNNIIQHNTIYGLIEVWGAGISLNGAVESVISNTVIANNEAASSGIAIGGGIYIWEFSNTILKNVTIVNNSAQSGGGINSGSIYAELFNCIIWNNTPDQISGPMFTSYSDIMGGRIGEGNIDKDPVFVDPANDDFQIPCSSPCWNTGADSIQIENSWHYCPGFDFDGNPRPDTFYFIPDMGAYEYADSCVNTYLSEYDNKNSVIVNLNTYPNPFSTTTTIEYEHTKPGTANITIFNHLGQIIENTSQMNRQSGKQQYVWDASGMPAGIYFVRVRAGRDVVVRKIVMM